jgi:hypothetical protein
MFVRCGWGVEKSNIGYYLDSFNVVEYKRRVRAVRKHLCKRRRIRVRMFRAFPAEIRGVIVRKMQRRIIRLRKKKVPVGDEVAWRVWWRKMCDKRMVFDRHVNRNVRRVLSRCVGVAQVDVPLSILPAVTSMVEQYHDDGIGGQRKGKSLHLLSYNIGSLLKYGRVCLDNFYADVYMFQETLYKSVIWSDLPSGWQFVHSYRENVKGGGICFIVRAGVQIEKLEGSFYRHGDMGIEWIWLRIRCEKGWLYLCNLYLPPMRAILGPAKYLVDQINDFIGREGSMGCLITGDFNCFLLEPGEVVNVEGGASSTYVKRGCYWQRLFASCRYPPVILNRLDLVPTHVFNGGGSVIDYVIWFGSSAGIVKHFKVVGGFADHNMLTAELQVDLMPIEYVP